MSRSSMVSMEREESIEKLEISTKHPTEMASYAEKNILHYRKMKLLQNPNQVKKMKKLRKTRNPKMDSIIENFH